MAIMDKRIEKFFVVESVVDDLLKTLRKEKGMLRTILLQVQ